MIDASGGFMKDGPKNRLRSQDIHKIVDVFNHQHELAKFSRMVPSAEIEKNEFNLNIPRYIDSQVAEDIQDIAGHLKGGIPASEVDSLDRYWAVCPQLRKALFRKKRSGYLDLAVDKAAIKSTIFEHPEFTSFKAGMNALFDVYQWESVTMLKALKPGFNPKDVVNKLSEGILAHYADKPLINHYDVYQHLMDYWAETMQDDCYIIAVDGWKAETTRIIVEDKKGKKKDKGWTCDLVPKEFVVARYFSEEQEALDQFAVELENVTARLTELEEEHGGEEGAFSELEKVNKGNVTERLKEIKGDIDAKDEAGVLKEWLKLNKDQAAMKKAIKDSEAELDAKVYAQYPKLTEDEVKALGA
jgi:type I restriction enzyme M protein